MEEVTFFRHGSGVFPALAELPYFW
jgi:hypothetical protein